ncbi:lipase 3-like [Diachasmimorpha longicaudata]|uniref:lipase 3-like n=1 Tax=Diachasmimorpha longicaudata TaxID=58733 RepID=UPI0030B89D6B
MFKCSQIIIPILFVLLPAAAFDLRTKYFRSDEEAKGTKFYALDFLGLVEKHGRKAEWHNVTTEDGYILSLFRLLPNSSHVNETVKGRTFYLQHGMGACADIYILLGPGRSLAYSLSDAGYDVWVGNLRGTHYGRRHKKYSTDDSVFWDFSMDDYALRDLPAILDYILATTGETQLSYLGHSLGTTIILILLADKPEYNSKLTLAILYAPVSYWKTWNPTRVFLALTTSFAKPFLPTATEFPTPTILPAAIIHYICLLNPLTIRICVIPVEFVLGEDREQIDVSEVVAYIALYYPAGHSAKVLFHYGQHVQSGKFAHYKEGHDGADLEYNLKNIRVPMIIFEAQNDHLVPQGNAEYLLTQLPPDLELRYELISHKKFTHGDYVAAKDVEEILYNPMLQILEESHVFKRKVDD